MRRQEVRNRRFDLEKERTARQQKVSLAGTNRKPTIISMSGLLCVALALCLLVTAGCVNAPSQNQEGQNQGPKVVSKEDSQKIAADFLRSSPTFRFDGIEETLKLVWSGGEEPYHWEFHYEFQCRHAGYGDRTGLILAQVITDHRAQIVVERGEVVHAVLDGKWDMLRQKIIE